VIYVQHLWVVGGGGWLVQWVAVGGSAAAAASP